MVSGEEVSYLALARKTTGKEVRTVLSWVLWVNALKSSALHCWLAGISAALSTPRFRAGGSKDPETEFALGLQFSFEPTLHFCDSQLLASIERNSQSGCSSRLRAP